MAAKTGDCCVFLGGSCNPTTWRRDIAIPALESANVPYYNPQIDDWSPDLIEAEARAKRDATHFLWIIDGKTRAIASMVEATEFMLQNLSSFYLVIEEIKEGLLIDGAVVEGRELKDLNRGRAYLEDVACRNGVTVFKSVEEAVSHLIQSCNH